MAMDANKQKALIWPSGKSKRLSEKEAICKLGGGNVQKVEAIPTGALSLDLALGVGGLPRGRVIEIYGPEAGRKTNPVFATWAAQNPKNGRHRGSLSTRNTRSTPCTPNIWA